MHIGCYVLPNSHRSIQVERKRVVNCCLNSSKRGKRSEFGEHGVNMNFKKNSQCDYVGLLS